MPTDYTAIYRLLAEMRPEIETRAPRKTAVTLARTLPLFATAEETDWVRSPTNIWETHQVTNRRMVSSSDSKKHASLRMSAMRILDDIAAFHKLPMSPEAATTGMLMYTIAQT